jgi:hypothetical protein
MQLERLAQTNAQVSGTDLAAMADKTHQVIWGEFVGTLPADSDQEWIVIRAIDSAYYEITTSDDTVVAKIKAAFTDVRSPE